VVLLHGRGSDETEIIALAEHLPTGPAYAAVRAPIAEGGGYAWFANRGLGRPIAASLVEQMAWFRNWLDETAPRGRPVVLVGFSGGAAFAGGLVLADPTRFAGAAILYGTLPFDAGVPLGPARLAGLPVFVAQGEQDHVLPAELMAATWSYLLGDSGAPAMAGRYPGGHGLTPAAVADLAQWLGERLAYLAVHGPAPVGPAADVTWRGLPGGVLPARRGSRPAVQHRVPQQQLDQNAPTDLQERLFARLIELDGVSGAASAISVPGARGFILADAQGPDEAFLVPSAGEFAHLHPAQDGSLHLSLPMPQAADVLEKGWGVAHPLAGVRLTPGMVMVFGPRDDAELDTVTGIVTASYDYARQRVAS
jgi:phospholipase/carboxylesterase